VSYTLHPAAEQDLADALDFYVEQAGRSVAQRFLDEFERVDKLVSDHPGLGSPGQNGRRVFPLRVFPYALVYRPFEDHVRIIVVRHQHRKPGYGGGRR
jgi:plasmid stabilization system protein ParE